MNRRTAEMTIAAVTFAAIIGTCGIAYARGFLYSCTMCSWTAETSGDMPQYKNGEKCPISKCKGKVLVAPKYSGK